MNRDYAADPSPRILAAESGRAFRELLDAGSLGTPGARVMRRRAGSDEPLTAEEQTAVDAEMAELERDLRGGRS